MIRTVLLCVLAVAGCAKVDDLGRAQDDGTQIARSFIPRIDELSRRTEIVARADLQPDARNVLAHVKGLVQEARTRVTAAPTQLVSAAKSGRIEDVIHTTDELQTKVTEELIEAEDGVEAMENAVAIDEARPKQVKPVTAPAPVGSEPSDQPTPPPPP